MKKYLHMDLSYLLWKKKQNKSEKSKVEDNILWLELT